MVKVSVIVALDLFCEALVAVTLIELTGGGGVRHGCTSQSQSDGDRRDCGSFAHVILVMVKKQWRLCASRFLCVSFAQVNARVAVVDVSVIVVLVAVAVVE
jgi:hypothetical protein